MSEERMTYAELRFPYSKKQNDKRHPTQKKRELPCQVIAIILAVVCCFLLLAVTALAYMYKDCNTCRGKWSCCGKNCYYFSKEKKTWNESKKSCQDLGSSLIKIDDKEEQIFIQSKIKYNYWVGLYKQGDIHPWRWPDGSTPSENLSFLQTIPDGKCGHLKSGNIFNAVCAKSFHFICEKTFTCIDD